MDTAVRVINEPANRQTKTDWQARLSTSIQPTPLCPQLWSKSGRVTRVPSPIKQRGTIPACCSLSRALAASTRHLLPNGGGPNYPTVFTATTTRPGTRCRPATRRQLAADLLLGDVTLNCRKNEVCVRGGDRFSAPKTTRARAEGSCVFVCMCVSVCVGVRVCG